MAKDDYTQTPCICGHLFVVHKFGKRYYEWQEAAEYPHNEHLVELTSLDGCKYCGCISFGADVDG